MSSDFAVLSSEAVYMCSSILERQGVPHCRFHLTPMVPTEEHAPPVGFGTGETWFRWVSRIKWRQAIRAKYHDFYKDAVDEHRAQLGMGPTAGSPYEDVDEEGAPPVAVLGYSPTLCPPPHDWDPQRVFVVGALIDGDAEKTYAPPPELSAPLGLASRETTKPIIVTFGSNLVRGKEETQGQGPAASLCGCSPQAPPTPTLQSTLLAWPFIFSHKAPWFVSFPFSLFPFPFACGDVGRHEAAGAGSC